MKKEIFYTLCSKVFDCLNSDEQLTLFLEGENSQYFRFNDSKLRQSGIIEDFNLTLSLYNKNKCLQSMTTISADLDSSVRKVIKEIDILKNIGAIIEKAKWDIQVPDYKVRGRNHLKTQFARAFIPDYFTGYKIYIWLDADTWINHKDTFTGITDDDRSLTARLFAELVDESTNLSEEEARFRLASSFRIPGHVPVCIADKDILKGRQGHTELIVALMKYARLTPVALGCEMLSDNGKALPPEEARFWAEERGHLFLEGRQIVEKCQ